MTGRLAFELVLAALGIILGLAAGLIFRVFRDQGIPWSQTGIGYALLWIVVIAARVGFAEATSHSRSLQVWLGTHHITPDAITDALIFMAVGMLLTRTAALRLRAAALPGRCPGPRTRHAAAKSLLTRRPLNPAASGKECHGSPHRRLAGDPGRDRHRRHGHLAQERRGMALRARRQQARQAAAGQRPDA
jgi:hypothetical protein